MSMLLRRHYAMRGIKYQGEAEAAVEVAQPVEAAVQETPVAVAEPASVEMEAPAKKRTKKSE